MPTLESHRHRTTAIAHENLEAAADWFALLRDGEADEQTQQEWQQWLQQADAHQAAWNYVTGVSQRFAQFQQQGQGHIAASVLQARQQQRFTRRKAVGILLGVGIVGPLGWMGYRASPLPNLITAWQADQYTATGEIRELSITAGVQLWLNTASAINTHIHNGIQQVHLLQGEVFIDKHSPSALPLQVITEHGEMRPLGTKFVVRQEAQETFLAVYDGRVDLKIAASNQQRQIQAGEQLRFGATTLDGVDTADPARKAWIQGVLLAQNMRLEDLLAELARYQHGHFSVSPEVADLRVLGSYPLNDPEKALTMLSEVLPIQLQRPLPWWVRVERL